MTSLDDMEGKVFGFGDPNSTSGYLIPSIEIPQYKDGVTVESGEYFGEVDLEARLGEWERFYKFHRPKGAHKGKTPYEALREKL